MVVVMEERASEAQIEQVVARLVEMGMDVHRSTGVTRTVLGAVGQGHPGQGADRAARRRARGAAHLGAVQAGEQDVQARRHDRVGRRRPDRRRRGDRHGRPVLGGERAAGARRRRRREARRREDFPRRRVQAAQLPVQLPGARRRRAAAAARRVERREPQADYRGDGSQPDRGHRQVHRHLPGRRAQHAELHAAARARARARSRC